MRDPGPGPADYYSKGQLLHASIPLIPKKQNKIPNECKINAQHTTYNNSQSLCGILDPHRQTTGQVLHTSIPITPTHQKNEKNVMYILIILLLTKNRYIPNFFKKNAQSQCRIPDQDRQTTDRAPLASERNRRALGSPPLASPFGNAPPTACPAQAQTARAQARTSSRFVRLVFVGLCR